MAQQGKLPRTRELAISALLESKTIVEAAGKVGITERTLRRWMARPEFAASFREAQRGVLGHTLARLQQIASDAVETLSNGMRCEDPSVQVRAATVVLSQLLKVAELADLEQRLLTLETHLTKE